MAEGEAQVVAATERWFLKRGIPHFIEGYDAGSDVFTRTLPALGFVFLVEVLGAANLEWAWWKNLLAIVGGLAVLVGAFVAVNKLRHRPAFRRPDDVGAPELAAFVLVPAVLPVLFDSQPTSAVVTGVVNLTLLGLIYLVTSYGLIPMTRWALGQTVRQVGTVLGLFGRALPLLLLLGVGLFLAAEVWQAAASLDGVLFWLTVLLFVLSGLLFLLARLPAELKALRDEAEGDRATLRAACEGTPVASALPAVLDGGAGDDQRPPGLDTPPLSRRQQGNVLLVLLFSQAVQVLLVTVAISAFFFLFGLLAIRPEVAHAWVGDAGHEALVTFSLIGHRMEISRALLHVAGFLGVVSGFYFTIYVITDATYRQEFFEEIVGEVRQSLAVRAVYLQVRGDPDPSTST